MSNKIAVYNMFHSQSLGYLGEKLVGEGVTRILVAPLERGGSGDG